MTVANADSIANVEVGEAIGEAFPRDFGQFYVAVANFSNALGQAFAVGVVEEETVFLERLGDLEEAVVDVSRGCGGMVIPVEKREKEKGRRHLLGDSDESD